MTATATTFRYQGSGGTKYADIATRGQESLGIGVRYVTGFHPPVGAVEIRFVAHSENEQFSPFTHLLMRTEGVGFRELGPDGRYSKTGKKFSGVRLVKIGIPVFTPGPDRRDLKAFGNKFGLWEKVGNWITEQAQTEGFTPTVDVAEVVKDLLLEGIADLETVQDIFQPPDLKEMIEQMKAQKAALIEGFGEGEDDGDEDDDESVN